MADKLHFSLVSPEQELFSGDVDQVDVPGTEGDLGIMPDHSPLMAAIRTGAITVYEGGSTRQYFIQGGFADVTPAGLTVLAEKAVAMDDLSRDAIEADIAALQSRMNELDGDAALTAQQDLDGLNAVLAGL